MKKSILFLTTLLIVGSEVVAQRQRDVVIHSETPGKKPVIQPIASSVGAIVGQKAVVTKEEFLQNMEQGLISADPNYVVKEFEVVVVTHNLYEDSSGTPIIVSDMFTDYSFSNQFNDGVKKYFKEDIKNRDTFYFDKIRLQSKDGQKMTIGSPFQIAIQKK